MRNSVHSIISFAEKHRAEIKFQYAFSNTLVKNFVSKKGRNF